MFGLRIRIHAFMYKNYFHYGSLYEMGDSLTKFMQDKLKAIPIQVWRGPYDSKALRLPNVLDSHMEVARLSALCNGRLYSPGDVLGIHFC